MGMGMCLGKLEWNGKPPTHPYPIPLSYLLRMNLVEDKVQLHQSYEKVGETIITEIFIVYHEVLN